MDLIVQIGIFLLWAVGIFLIISLIYCWWVVSQEKKRKEKKRNEIKQKLIDSSSKCVDSPGKQTNELLRTESSYQAAAERYPSERAAGQRDNPYFQDPWPKRGPKTKSNSLRGARQNELQGPSSTELKGGDLPHHHPHKGNTYTGRDRVDPNLDSQFWYKRLTTPPSYSQQQQTDPQNLPA